MKNKHFSALGITPVINAVGYATRVGGSRPQSDVLDAMAEASRHCFEIDDLETAAWNLIAGATGAEGGIITCGAGAALTLGAAACLVGNDPDAMDRLPDTSGLARREIIYPRPGPFDYDHAVRLSGAKLIEIDYEAPDALTLIEAAIGPSTCAVGYVWLAVDQRPTLKEVAALAHSRGLPLIMDGALSLPPTEHLGAFIADGADLVAVSGGKHLCGPQASGMLLGKRDLVRSAWVQMVDMDVRPGTWSLQRWVDEKWISRPPRHGIGRSMKVSKEAIVGLMVALRAYPQRDFYREQGEWRRRVQRIADALGGLPKMRCRLRDTAPNGQAFPCVELGFVESDSDSMQKFLKRMRTEPPRIVFAEDEQDPGVARIFPMCLTDAEAETLILRVRAAVQEIGATHE